MDSICLFRLAGNAASTFASVGLNAGPTSDKSECLTTMKTLVIFGPGEVGYGEKEVPVPGADEVLLHVRRVGFCGSDLSTFRGGNPMVTYPRMPGHEVAAEIAATGPAVPGNLKVGSLVTVMPYTSCGGCAACRRGRFNACRNNRTLGVQQEGVMGEWAVIHWSKVVPAPLSLPELALVEPLAVGFHAVSRGRVVSSDRVLVFGCGMVGLGAIAAAGLRIGAEVIAVDIDDGKLATAGKAGARHVVNSQRESLAERIAEITGGHGVDVAIEAVGSPATFVSAVEQAAFTGRVVYIGYAKAPVSYETKYFVMKELDILGSRNATPEDFAAVVDLLRSGRYPTSETITRTVPLAEAGEALRSWASNPGPIIKIQVAIS